MKKLYLVMMAVFLFLVVVAAQCLAKCPGDFDHDGDVDGSDLALFVADFGRTDCSGDCEGDFDGDWDVDGSDLAVFAADFGRTDCQLIPIIDSIYPDIPIVGSLITINGRNFGLIPGTVYLELYTGNSSFSSEFSGVNPQFQELTYHIGTIQGQVRSWTDTSILALTTASVKIERISGITHFPHIKISKISTFHI